MVTTDPSAATRSAPPADSPLPPVTRSPMTPGEVRELWAFVHGDIMVSGIREILRRSLGLCPRHTWAYAIVEIELWEHGAGARGGHQPFDVTILYKDLAVELAEKLVAHHAPWHADLRDIITPTQGCRICHDLRGTDQSRTAVGYAGMNIPALTEVANRLNWTTAWIQETEPLWRPLVCPMCTRGRGADATVEDRELLCRTHLTGGPLRRGEAERVADRLRALAEDMAAIVQSMTRDGPIATPEQNAAWITALGWFAQWEAPLDIASRSPGA